MTNNPEIENEIENEEDTSLADDIARLKAQNESANEQAEDEPKQEQIQEKEQQEEKPEELNQVDEDEEEEDEEEKQRILKAQEDYKKRQAERKQKALEQQNQAKYQEQANATVDDADKQAIEFIKDFQRQQQFQQSIKSAEAELTQLEGEFKVAYPDYEDKVSQAIKLTKSRLVNSGMSELEAEQQLKQEKILLADRAAARGEDPVEAVYNEAKSILGVFEQFAEEMGYTKGKKKTNLQALREASKPNAMSGGTGKGATAARKTFEDLESDEVDELSIGQLLNGGI